MTTTKTIGSALPLSASDIAARHRVSLSAVRLAVGVLKSDAERLTWIAHEIGKRTEVAGLHALSLEAAQIALRAFDASEVLDEKP